MIQFRVVNPKLCAYIVKLFYNYPFRVGLIISHSSNYSWYLSMQGDIFFYPKHSPIPPILQIYSFFQFTKHIEAVGQLRGDTSWIFFEDKFILEQLLVITPSYLFPPTKYTFPSMNILACEDTPQGKYPMLLTLRVLVLKSNIQSDFLLFFLQPPEIK